MINVLAAGLLAAALVVPQDAPANDATAEPIQRGADANLTRSVRRIADQLVQLRGESFSRKPNAIRSPDVMADVVAEARAYRVIAPQRLEARGRGWNDLGFGGPASPTLLWLTLSRDLPGIDLDADGRRLLVSPSILTQDDYGVGTDERIFVPDGQGGHHELRPGESGETSERASADSDAADFLLATGVRPDEPLLAHYLIHLRQLERRGEDSLRETTDGLLAAAAWAEGEANLVSLYFLFRGVGLARAVLTGPVGPGDFIDGRLLPDALSEATPLDAELLDFVYEGGYDHAIGHWRESGWGVFDGPAPRTTRQLLDPTRPPADLTWPPAEPPAPGLRSVDSDRLGQHAIASLVSIWTGSGARGLAAGAGWAGDRLTRWESSPDEGVTVWETRWETEADAAEFAEAFEQVVRRRDRSAAEAATDRVGEAILETRFRRFVIFREANRVKIEIRAR